MLDANDVPRFGVPERVPNRDVPFVAVVGLGLTVVLWGILGMAFEAFDVAFSADNPAAVVAMLFGLGLGPAIAYHLLRRLRASRISLARGCASLFAWVVLLGVGGGVAGWLGIALVGALGGGAILRLGVGADAGPELARGGASTSAPSAAFNSRAGTAAREGSFEVGDAIFYICVFGAIGGMTVGGAIGLVTNNVGLKEIDNAGGFLIATGFAAIGVGVALSLAWAIVFRALARSHSATGRMSTEVIALVASALTATMFMLVAQPLAGPVAIWTLVLSSLATALIAGWQAFKLSRNGRSSGGGRR